MHPKLSHYQKTPTNRSSTKTIELLPFYKDSSTQSQSSDHLLKMSSFSPFSCDIMSIGSLDFNISSCRTAQTGYTGRRIRLTKTHHQEKRKKFKYCNFFGNGVVWLTGIPKTVGPSVLNLLSCKGHQPNKATESKLVLR